MYNNPYMPNVYNPQASIDRINNQIAELEKMKQQIPQTPITQPTNLTQNFQISPTNREVIRYAGSLDEVQRDMVLGDTPYFSKDMSVVWIKNTKGDIKTYELKEIVPLDDKDIQIQYLEAQIRELKGKIKYEPNVSNVNSKQITTDTSTNDDEIRTTIKNGESTSISKVSRSKTK